MMQLAMGPSICLRIWYWYRDYSMSIPQDQAAHAAIA